MSYYTILIICEGEKTEPLFFNSLKDELISGNFNNDIRNIQLTIAPELPVDNNKSIIKVKHKPSRKKRTTKRIKKIDNDKTEIKILSGKPPTRWVLTAKQHLQTGAFDEVWAVFDNDNHPEKREAFEEAKEEVNGKKVNIAYSSRSFEYYLLIHFERIYRVFHKTDCKIDRNTFIRCGTNKYPDNDCKGNICINGYAQKNNYWNNTDKSNTKNSHSAFHYIKDKIELGFINSAWIRYRSDIVENKIPIYDKNPYLTIDRLVKKLIDNEKEYIWVSKNKEYYFKNIKLSIKSSKIVITNISNKTIILPNKSVFVIGKEIICLNKKEIIEVMKELEIDISIYKSDDYWFKIEFENNLIMFENETQKYL